MVYCLEKVRSCVLAEFVAKFRHPSLLFSRISVFESFWVGGSDNFLFFQGDKDIIKEMRLGYFEWFLLFMLWHW